MNRMASNIYQMGLTWDLWELHQEVSLLSSEKYLKNLQDCLRRYESFHDWLE